MNSAIPITLRRKKRMKKTKTLLLNSPYIVWSAIFIIVPLVIVAYYAFTGNDGSFSIANIKGLWNYRDNFLVSIEYSLVATAISLVVAYPFAYFLSKASQRSQRTQTMLIMLPMWMNMLITTYSWMNIFEKNGVINTIIGKIGIGPVTFLGTPGAVILGMVYNYLPYMILPIYTVLEKIDVSLIEAAHDLGCNGATTWWKLILPLSMPGVISGITMVFVPSVSTFYISQKLGSGKIMMIGDTIERQMRQQNNYHVGAALSLVLMIIILLSMFIMNRFSDDSEGGIVV